MDNKSKKIRAIEETILEMNLYPHKFSCNILAEKGRLVGLIPDSKNLEIVELRSRCSLSAEYSKIVEKKKEELLNKLNIPSQVLEEYDGDGFDIFTSNFDEFDYEFDDEFYRIRDAISNNLSREEVTKIRIDMLKELKKVISATE